MKIALSLVITVITIIALYVKPLRKHRAITIAVYAVSVICVFLFYNLRTAGFILPFYKPVNQMFYQPEFSLTSEYPDAALPYLLKDKTIHIPKILEWDDSIKETYEHWQSGGMLNMNMYNILTENGAEVSMDEYMFMLDRDKLLKDMTELGYFNDSFRYSFFYNDLESEYGNSFYYYWFYGANAIPFKLYVCPVGYEEAKELYMMFDPDANIYLISKEYFETEVISNE